MQKDLKVVTDEFKVLDSSPRLQETQTASDAKTSNKQMNIRFFTLPDIWAYHIGKGV